MLKKTMGIYFLFFALNLYAQPTKFYPGEYYMLDSPVNIRSEPNTNSKIIGKLNLHDKIKVIETTEQKQIIDGINQFWYKIEYNNIIGYIWGGYIAEKQFIFDLDNNAVKDYIYYRRPNWAIVLSRDIFIYLNNKKIPVNISDDRDYNCWHIFQDNGITYLKLGESDDGWYVYVNIYTISREGKINFIKHVWQTIGGEAGPLFYSVSFDDYRDEANE
jgi:hypothetical protein